MHAPRSGIGQYQQARKTVDESDPHKVISLLLAGAIERVRQGAAAIERGDQPAKVQAVNRAIGIVDGLRMSLDLDAGGEIAAGLDALYEYMGQCLIQANVGSDASKLEEVRGLLQEIQTAWAEIPQRLGVPAPAASGAEAGRLA